MRERCAVPRERRVFDNRRPTLSVVVPCYNEVEVLACTHARLTQVLVGLAGFECEQIYVDDGSADGTWEVVNSLAAASSSVRAVRLSRNFGHQAACLAGLRESVGDAVVVIDADLQDPPELIPELAALWRDGWSVVSARRRSRDGETLFKKASAYAFYRLLNALSDHSLALDTGDFRLLDRELVALLTGVQDKNLYLRGAVSWFGLPETSVTYDRDARQAGESKYTLRKMLALSRRGLLAGSVAPLRLSAYLGTAVLAGGVAAAAVQRDARLLARPGAFGAHALALGVIGEYLHAVFRQVQGRPDYVIQDRLGGGDRPGAASPSPSTKPVKEPVALWLLRRSSIHRRTAGRRLALHLNLRTIARFPRVVDAVRGTMFTAQVQEHSALGMLVMPSNLTPGGLGAALAGRDPRQVDELLDARPYLGMFTTQVRMQGAAGIAGTVGGTPLLRHGMTRADHHVLCLAFRRTAQLLFAAGAVELLPPTSTAGPLRTAADVDAYCAQVKPSDWELVSVHGMASCPMALPERGGVCDESGRPHGFNNLYVCDASVLPGAPGISPQGTIMSFAHEIVGRQLESA
jgi:hypothetical protein